jgi:REP element-mobilizing transposase RayT
MTAGALASTGVTRLFMICSGGFIAGQLSAGMEIRRRRCTVIAQGSPGHRRTLGKSLTAHANPERVALEPFILVPTPKGNENMGQSLAQIYLHIVFSTKHRQPFLQDPVVRQKMHTYLKGICKNQGSPWLAVGGVEDHVHIACRLNKNIGVAVLIKELKQGSSTWIKSEFDNQSSFHWQNGYGAFSVSPSHVPGLIQYIDNQEAHHRRESFQAELRRLLTKYDVEYDERYVWD